MPKCPNCSLTCEFITEYDMYYCYECDEWWDEDDVIWAWSN